MTAAPYNWHGSEFRLLDSSRMPQILEELDAACLQDGQLQVMPASFYAQWPQNDLSIWCVKRGFYCLPTLELVEFVRDQIDCEDTVEIGAGNGALGRAVGVTLTDSYQQERPDVQELYSNELGQATVPYGKDVEKLTALEAVEKYRPRVVLAAWVTHRFDRQRTDLRGNMHGVDEGKLLGKRFVKKYIFVGHERVHGTKPILSRRHATHRLPFLYSRAFDRRDVVWVWG